MSKLMNIVFKYPVTSTIVVAVVIWTVFILITTFITVSIVTWII